jgi:hypothetical protein
MDIRIAKSSQKHYILALDCYHFTLLEMLYSKFTAPFMEALKGGNVTISLLEFCKLKVNKL